MSQAQVEKFVSVKEALEGVLDRPAAFLFHAERGLTEVQEATLAEHGIMCSDGGSISNNE